MASSFNGWDKWEKKELKTLCVCGNKTRLNVVKMILKDPS